MGNVLKVFKRDILRLLKVPPALIVVLALLILPSLYTWYNVRGFWDPYSNTGNLQVCIVNQDAAASSDLTGEVCVGGMIVEQLHKNNQLDWVFVDYDTAMNQVEAGESYAAFVIPKDFSKHLLSLTTGNFVQPKIQYYVNEKTGPVAPKVTDAGATMLDETVNSVFVETVSAAVADAFDQTVDEIQDVLDASNSKALKQLSNVVKIVSGTRTALDDAAQMTDSAQGKVQSAQDDLELACSQVETAAASLKTTSQLATQLQDELTGFSKLVAQVGDGSLAIAQVSTEAQTAISDVTTAAGEAQAQIQVALTQAQLMVDEYQAIASYARSVAESLPESSGAKDPLLKLADNMDAKVKDAQKVLDNLQALDKEAGNLSQSIEKTSHSLNSAIQDATKAVKAYSDSLSGTTIPALNQSLAQLSASSSSLSGLVSSQTSLIDQTSLLLNQLGSTLEAAEAALNETDGLMANLEESLESVQADLIAFGTSDVLGQVFGKDGLDAQKIAEFMRSPTELTTKSLYQPNSYGAAMAPLFMNLTFWIGAFMLIVVLRQEVDDEGIENLTLTQRYLGRFLLFAVFAVLQALICCAGVLVIGVRAASVVALFFAAAVTSLAYLSIIYVLSVTLQHIGKGLCIVLVFAQIPGATGLYPIEMTPSFFQAVYPAFPFTYGIRAMREAICGFYGNHYVSALGVLALFFVAFIAIGLWLRPLMSGVNRMVAHQVSESNLFNGGEVVASPRRYRLSQLFKTLANKEECREQLAARYERFLQQYPRMIRGSIVTGLVVSVILLLVFAHTPAEKVWILTGWVIGLVLVLVFVVVIESMRAGFERQMRLDSLSDKELIKLASSRNRVQAKDKEFVDFNLDYAEEGLPSTEEELADEKEGGRHA